VTSRERLGERGELTYRVPSLTVPNPGDDISPDALLGYEGVRLFVDRAKLLRPEFGISADNAASLASICYRLDGIPLAIELAAPRLRSMSLEELRQRLDQRFALLTDGSRSALPRHRTLRSLIDWSSDLLTNGEAGRAECEEGRHDLALEHFVESLTILHGLGDRWNVFDSLERLADVAAATSAPSHAARLWGAAPGIQMPALGPSEHRLRALCETGPRDIDGRSVRSGVGRRASDVPRCCRALRSGRAGKARYLSASRFRIGHFDPQLEGPPRRRFANARSSAAAH